MELMSVIRTGLIAAIPVAIVCALLILIRTGAIHQQIDVGIQTAGFSGHNPLVWIGTWAAIAIVFGIVATWTYGYMSLHWNWGQMQYLALALVLAVGLSILGFVKIFNGQAHPFRLDWIGLNFAFAVGFGYLIPRLVG